MSSAISFGVFWRLAPFDERDHPVEEALAGARRDADDDLVREHAGASRDGRAVAAGFADDRGGLAGDRRLVDARDALDDVPVGGDDLAGGDDDVVADGEPGAGHVLDRPVGQPPSGGRLGACLAQRRGLSLAAPLRHRFGEVREDDGEPEPGGDAAGEDVCLRGCVTEILEEENRCEGGAELGHEHDGVAGHAPWVEFANAVESRRCGDPRVED